MKKIVIAASLLLSFNSIRGQDATTQGPGLSPRIAVEPPAFDFGQVLPQKTLTKEFSIRNFGRADLVIVKVSTSCGCTAALLDDKTRVIKPGSHAPLKVELRTSAAAGRISKAVLVQSNDPTRSTYEIKVEATVVAPKPLR